MLKFLLRELLFVKDHAGLHFPFVEVNDVERVFGGVPNYADALQACPSKFRLDPGKWGKAAFQLQTGGWTDERQQNALQLLTAQDPETARKQVAYLTAWLNSFQPSHEEKMAVCGWLMSLMFRKCPQW